MVRRRVATAWVLTAGFVLWIGLEPVPAQQARCGDGDKVLFRSFRLKSL